MLVHGLFARSSFRISSCVFLLYSSFLSWNIEFLGIFHVSACCCVGHLGHLKGFGMLVLCARVYLAVGALWRHKRCVLKRHIVDV